MQAHPSEYEYCVNVKLSLCYVFYAAFQATLHARMQAHPSDDALSKNTILGYYVKKRIKTERLV